MGFSSKMERKKNEQKQGFQDKKVALISLRLGEGEVDVGLCVLILRHSVRSSRELQDAAFGFLVCMSQCEFQDLAVILTLITHHLPQTASPHPPSPPSVPFRATDMQRIPTASSAISDIDITSVIIRPKLAK